jgi:hypothetical protein
MISNLILSAQEGDKWWLAGGIHPSQVVAAYQPKGAVDLAASYVNLANPGTYDATVGVSPDLDAGWKFSGASQYLIGPPATSDGFAIRFSEATYNSCWVLGATKSTHELGFVNRKDTANRLYKNTHNYGGNTIIGGAIDSGVVVINNTACYLNSISDGTTQGSFAETINIWIGARNNNGVANGFTNGRIQAVCFFASGTTLTAAQIAALSAAMAAL